MVNQNVFILNVFDIIIYFENTPDQSKDRDAEEPLDFFGIKLEF